MNLFEKYYILGELRQVSLQGPPLSRNLQSVVQTQAIADLQGLCAELKHTLEVTPGLHTPNWEQFFRIVELYILLQVFLRDFEAIEKIHQQILDLNARGYAGQTEYAAAFEKWSPFLDFLTIGMNRLIRKAPLETFENALDEIEWGELPADQVYKYASAIAYVYRFEDNAEIKRKGKFWLDKATGQAPVALKYIFQTASFCYQTEIVGAEGLSGLDAKLNQLHQVTVEPYFSAAKIELLVALKTRVLMAQASFAETPADKEVQLQTIRRLLSTQLGKLPPHDVLSLYYFTKLYVKNFLQLEALYQGGQAVGDEALQQERQSLLESAAGNLEHIISNVPLPRNLQVEILQLKSYALAAQHNQREAARIIKECAFHYRKTGLLPQYAVCHFFVAQMYLQIRKSQKAYDAAMEVFRYGLKKLDVGGMYICVKALRFMNNIFAAECDKPGVSWMVNELYPFFQALIQLHEQIPQYVDKIGAGLFDEYKKEYLRLRKASNFNIKTYFLYQLHQIKVLELSALFQSDVVGRQIAESLIESLRSTQNPLNFITTEWIEFKDVADDVRNKVINKCISITKGDLPLAASHLDFSYRNLRSYITYNEVNRLGFFLEERDTNARKLELGVRYLLHDLYLKGKIFDVVFDMPRFLVSHAAHGFTANDMERELSIKYNTAKKYLKIMMEMEMIEQDAVRRKKNYYAINQDKILSRYNQLVEETARTTETVAAAVPAS